MEDLFADVAGLRSESTWCILYILTKNLYFWFILLNFLSFQKQKFRTFLYKITRLLHQMSTRSVFIKTLKYLHKCASITKHLANPSKILEITWERILNVKIVFSNHHFNYSQKILIFCALLLFLCKHSNEMYIIILYVIGILANHRKFHYGWIAFGKLKIYENIFDAYFFTPNFFWFLQANKLILLRGLMWIIVKIKCFLWNFTELWWSLGTLQ